MLLFSVRTLGTNYDSKTQKPRNDNDLFGSDKLFYSTRVSYNDNTYD
jgi:hypothetical protein